MPAESRKKTPKRILRQAKQPRSKATVNAIVEAAARILADDGWQGVNTNAIARRAGVSVGYVYEYFPDKQAILAVIIDRHLAGGEAMLADAANGLVSGMEIDDIVSALVFGFVRLHEDDPRLHRALASEVPISAAQRKRIAALRSTIVTLVADALSEHVDEAELKATLLVDTADALAHRWIVDEVGLPASADIMIAQASKMLKGYLS